jgi:surface carbohydrate biosynthesis protein
VLNQLGNVLFTSPGARTVLIHADHKRRDAVASMLIGHYLKDLGYNVVVGNRLLSRTLYHLFQPEVVLTTHPDMIFSPSELAREAKRCRFVLMHPESSGMIRDSMMTHMRGGKKETGDAYTKHYSRVLTWGPVLKDWVVDEGLYPEAIVETVGCARYDFYRDMRRPALEERSLGGMPSFTGISRYNRLNPFENIHAGRNQHGIHYGAEGGYEDFLWTSAAYVRLFLEFLDLWCLELGNRIDFRPYTLECLEDYAFFRNRYGRHFRADVRSPFPQWLSRRSASVFCYSSSVIESIVSGIPYITLQSVIEDRLEFHQPKAECPETRGELYDYTHRPKTIQDVVDLAHKAGSGDLGLAAPFEESPGLRKLLWDYYGWPRPEPSSLLVARAIHGMLEHDRALDHGNSRWRFVRDAAKVPWRVWLHTNGGRSWSTFSDHHFMPWHVDEKPYAYEAWRRLSGKRP